MIDARRWALVETTSIGDGWQTDDEERTSFYYEGSRVWRVAESSRGFRTGPAPTVPQMGTEAMRHELAHYLAATAEQRGLRNFGLTSADNDAEERALEMESVLDAMLDATNRIATLALRAG